jgi:phage/plasmid-like protein (TIGR03299 family)
MAHDLYLNSAMAFAGALPWHGLGTALPRNATWETIKAILPFYDVVERQIYAAGIPSAIPDRKALIASNDGRYLATVGADYGVVQFSQLAEIVMRAAGKEAVFHTAGLLGDNGARGWLLGELPNPIKVQGDSSEIRKFFLATTAHDGTSAVHLRNVATRVVCANTLGSALGEKGAGWSIRHTSGAPMRVEAAGSAFKAMIVGMENFGQLANRMSAVKLSSEQRAKIVADTFPMAEDATDRVKAKAQDARECVLRLAEQGTGVDSGIRGTAWAMFQGVTEWADHIRPIRGLKALPSITQTFESQLWGAAVDIKRLGLDAIRSVASI